MEKIKKEDELLNDLKDKLYEINPCSSGSSARMKILEYSFLELIEKSDLRKIAYLIHDYIENNTYKYNYPERCDIITCMISDCNDIFFNNKDETRNTYNRYVEFIDIFNGFKSDYKISKNLNLEINKLEEMQKKIENSFNSINKKYKEVENKIDKINYDLIGTISLFIGVIFAIYGGFQLTNSVFSYIGEIEFKYLLIALSVIGFIELSIVSLLVYFVFIINDRNGRDIWKIDSFYALLMIVLIVICTIIN